MVRSRGSYLEWGPLCTRGETVDAPGGASVPSCPAEQTERNTQCVSLSPLGHTSLESRHVGNMTVTSQASGVVTVLVTTLIRVQGIL